MENHTELNTSGISTKKSKHVILSIPILAAVLLYVYTFVIQAIAAEIGRKAAGDDYSAFFMIGSVILMLLIHKLWFRGEYKGSFRWDQMTQKSLLIPVLVYFIVDMAQILREGFSLGFALPSLAYFGLVLSAGVDEEIVNRVLIMTTALRTYVRKGNYMPALILASAVFGLGHLFNLAAGQSIGMACLQVFSTFFAGLLLGAIYLRSGNILYSIIIHFAHDLGAVSIAGVQVVSSGTVTLEQVLYYIGIAAFQLVITIWLLKGHKQDIMEIWKERWSISEEEMI